MPGLSVSEKNHWKERLPKRIDKRIEAISAEDPNLLERVKRDAHDRAMKSLNLADLLAKIDRLEREEEELEKRERVLNRTMLARVRGVPLESIDELSVYQSGKHNQEVQSAITRRQAVLSNPRPLAVMEDRQGWSMRLRGDQARMSHRNSMLPFANGQL